MTHSIQIFPLCFFQNEYGEKDTVQTESRTNPWHAVQMHAVH